MIAPARKQEKALLTIGYEGLDIDHFLQFLLANRVDVLVDVREIPISRKRGFSKSRLAEAVSERGIAYRHIRALGSPAAIRRRLKRDWDYAAFFKAYEDYLDGQEDALEALCDIVDDHDRVCLMCFEKSHDQCHRRSVAARTAKTFKPRLSVEPVNTFVR